MHSTKRNEENPLDGEEIEDDAQNAQIFLPLIKH